MTTDKVVDISSGEKHYQVFGHSPVLNVLPDEGMDLDVYSWLLKAATADGNYNVYIKSGINDKFYYKNNGRVQPIVLMANEGTAFATTFWEDVKILNTMHNRVQSLNNKYGVAGYDPSLKSMQSVLMMR